MTIYYVSGTLIKEYSHFQFFIVRQEIEADSPRAAADHFEAAGWEWEIEPEIRLVSEAAKLERTGQPSLFDLEEVSDET